YLELVAQPARITPYTPSEVIARMYNRPALALDRTTLASNGITAQVASAGTSANIGASRYRNGDAAEGTSISLNSSLNTSAKVCRKPPKPTYFGPIRTCIQPISLRSHST